MRCRYLLLPLLSVLGLPVGADAQFRSDWHRGLSNTWQITVYSSGIDQPILREPSIEGGGGSELAVQQKWNVKTGKLSWLYAGQKWGVDLGLVYWSTELDDFQVRLQSFGGDTVTYRDASVRYIFLDTGVDWAPLSQVPIALYGVFGMGAETEKYTTSGGNAMPSFYGARNETAFQYSYGAGARFYPLHNLGLSAEFRWVPGDLVTELQDSVTCYYWSYDGSSSSNCEGSGSVRNHTRIASIGAFIVLP